MTETITLYRAVSLTEYEQLMETGQFEEGPNSLEGKWFAEVYDHALKWSQWLFPDGDFKIVSVTIPAELANRLHYEPKLDNVGPARYATIEELAGVEIRSVEP